MEGGAMRACRPCQAKWSVWLQTQVYWSVHFFVLFRIFSKAKHTRFDMVSQGNLFCLNILELVVHLEHFTSISVKCTSAYKGALAAHATGCRLTWKGERWRPADPARPSEGCGWRHMCTDMSMYFCCFSTSFSKEKHTRFNMVHVSH